MSVCPGGSYPPAYAEQAYCLSRAYSALYGFFADVQGAYDRMPGMSPQYVVADYLTYDANGNSPYLEQYESEKFGAWVR